LENIAHKAGVSRATIYRYFPNIDLLSTEASLDIHHILPGVLSEEVKNMPLDKSLFHIQSYYTQLAQDHELIFRRYLSVVLNESITSKKKIRGARRVDTLNYTLDSFKKDMSSTALDNLKNIATILMGIDALIVAKDVCGLSNNEANSTLKWGIEMILKGIQSDKKQQKKKK
jgi:AcrR family transcriptional regulator